MSQVVVPWGQNMKIIPILTNSCILCELLFYYGEVDPLASRLALICWYCTWHADHCDGGIRNRRHNPEQIAISGMLDQEKWLRAR